MSSEERMRILRMVEEKKISVEDANKLMESLAESVEDKLITVGKSSTKKFLRIVVEDGEDIVKVNLPLSLVKAGMSFIPKDIQARLDDQNIDIDDILHAVEEGAEGSIINVEEKDGAKVAIFLD